MGLCCTKKKELSQTIEEKKELTLQEKKEYIEEYIKFLTPLCKIELQKIYNRASQTSKITLIKLYISSCNVHVEMCMLSEFLTLNKKMFEKNKEYIKNIMKNMSINTTYQYGTQMIILNDYLVTIIEICWLEMLKIIIKDIITPDYIIHHSIVMHSPNIELRYTVCSKKYNRFKNQDKYNSKYLEITSLIIKITNNQEIDDEVVEKIILYKLDYSSIMKNNNVMIIEYLNRTKMKDVVAIKLFNFRSLYMELNNLEGIYLKQDIKFIRLCTLVYYINLSVSKITSNHIQLACTIMTKYDSNTTQSIDTIYQDALVEKFCSYYSKHKDDYIDNIEMPNNNPPSYSEANESPPEYTKNIN
jgi:hypothetical protein